MVSVASAELCDITLNQYLPITTISYITESSYICLTLLVSRNAAGPRWTPKSTVVRIFFAAAPIDRYPNFTAHRIVKARGRIPLLVPARSFVRSRERLEWIPSENLNAVKDFRFNSKNYFSKFSYENFCISYEKKA